MSPLVTIAIPTCDRLNYLEEAVASARAQSYGPLEILIGDDSRTASAEAWSRDLCGKDPRLKYRRNLRNLGMAGNWNALADAASGEFLTFLADDDRLLPNFVATLVRLIQPAFQVAFSNHYVIDPQGARQMETAVEFTELYGRAQLSPGEVPNADVCVWKNSVPISAALVRTSDVRRLRFKEDLNCPELEFFARLASEGGRFAFTPEYLAEYRTHSGSATSSGLTSERLVRYLADIPVSPEAELHKQKFVAEVLVDAVSRCLHQGRRDLAREFLRHRYYPGADGGPVKRDFTHRVQRACASLPALIGCPAYRLMQRIKRRLSRGSAPAATYSNSRSR